MQKIGIALSGGGFRGFAHLGVLQYLFEQGIIPSVISGTSVGSLVGVMIAEGYEPEELFKMGRSIKFANSIRGLGAKAGIFPTNTLKDFILKYIPHNSIEKLKIPSYIVSTNLSESNLLVFNEGPIDIAVRASCSFPLVFQPLYYNHSYLSDGGILNNFPVDIIEGKCDKIIGINISPISKIVGEMNIAALLKRTVQTAINSNVNHKIEVCDLYIEPKDIGSYGIFDTKKSDELYKLGYQSAKEMHEHIVSLKG